MERTNTFRVVIVHSDDEGVTKVRPFYFFNTDHGIAQSRAFIDQTLDDRGYYGEPLIGLNVRDMTYDEVADFVSEAAAPAAA